MSGGIVTRQLESSAAPTAVHHGAVASPGRKTLKDRPREIRTTRFKICMVLAMLFYPWHQARKTCQQHGNLKIKTTSKISMKISSLYQFSFTNEIEIQFAPGDKELLAENTVDFISLLYYVDGVFDPKIILLLAEQSFVTKHLLWVRMWSQRPHIPILRTPFPDLSTS